VSTQKAGKIRFAFSYFSQAMNRYGKKVVLKQEAEKYILALPTDNLLPAPDSAPPLNGDGILNFETLFELPSPVEIEIGFGTG